MGNAEYMGTALLASVQSPCFAPFSCLSPACWPSAGTWMTCTPGVTSTGTSLALTRSLRTGRQFLTTVRDAWLVPSSDAEGGQTELWSWTETQRPSLSRLKQPTDAPYSTSRPTALDQSN